MTHVYKMNMNQDIVSLNERVANLPDDIVIDIYTKILKKYRLHEGRFIKLIDFEKYKFLEKFIYRKAISFHRLPFDDGDEYRMDYKLANFSDLPDRKQQWIDDDLMNIYMTVSEKTVFYNVQRYRLKKIEDLSTKHKPSMYHRGDCKDYDWEVVSYVYTI